MRYSKEMVVQEDGNAAPFYFRRAADICDVVAERISALKIEEAFEIKNMRRPGNKLPPLPVGQVDHYVSPLVGWFV